MKLSCTCDQWFKLPYTNLNKQTQKNVKICLRLIRLIRLIKIVKIKDLETRRKSSNIT